MSKRFLGLAVVIIAGLALAACGDDSGSSSASTVASAGSTAASAGSTSAAASGAASTTSAGSAASGAATLTAADNSTIGQQILVNSAGMTVYLFVPDGTSTTSAVPAGIKANWPAVVADGTPVAGPSLDASKLSVAPQADGTQQVVYNGHLLYTFISDTAPGDAKGQDLGGAWYVLSPTGEQVGS